MNHLLYRQTYLGLCLRNWPNLNWRHFRRWCHPQAKVLRTNPLL